MDLGTTWAAPRAIMMSVYSIAVGHTTLEFVEPEDPVEKPVEPGDDDVTTLNLYDLNILTRKSVPQTKQKVKEGFCMDMLRFEKKTHQHHKLLTRRRTEIITPVQKRVEELAQKKKRERGKSLARNTVIPCIIPFQPFQHKPIKPFVKFRRVARAVKLLIQVCYVCRSLLADSVAQESWFAMVDNLAAAASLQNKKKGRAFITFVPDENRELVQLSFDVTEYMRNKKAEDYLTDDIRRIMRLRPGTRNPDQIAEVIRCMKGLCKSFNEYPLAIQKDICQFAFFDKYRHNRVILRQGLPPDGIYFVLSGQLVEKPEGKKQPTEIHAGEKFGEEDLVCGCSRRATVLTKHEVELLFLHRFAHVWYRHWDYREIFNMSADSTDAKNLDICRKDIIFSHFPLNKLKENPGTWSMLKYKYGRLIVKDSNELEWIYVIKSGEARVLKNLEPGRIDVQSRRKKIQEMMEEQSPFHKKKKILSFIADGVSKKSVYHPSVYQPSRRRMLQSAPSGPKKKGLGDDIFYHSLPSTPAGILKGSRPNTRAISKTPADPNEETKSEEEAAEFDDEEDKAVKLPKIKLKAPGSDVDTLSIGGDGKANGDYAGPKDDKNTKEEENEGGEDVMLITMDQIKAINDPKRSRTGKRGIFKRPQSPNKEKPNARPSTEAIPKPNRYINTPTGPRSESVNRRSSKSKEKPVQRMELPAFVQIETLHPGQTFGLRSCLEFDERGPSVSLVSGECEVIAINKKFFMRHCDDAMYSLIRLKAKPFPTQEELVDRLDANMQWEEFKQETLKDFLKQKIHTGR